MKTIIASILFSAACVASSDEPAQPQPITFGPISTQPHQLAACSMSLVVRQPEEDATECSARVLATARCAGHDGFMTASITTGSASTADTLDCNEMLEIDYAVPCASSTATLCDDDNCSATQCTATANVLPSCASDLADQGDTVTLNYFAGAYTFSTVIASYETYDCVEVGL